MNDVIIIGKPNSGKSTLFNVLIKKNKAITSGVMGTTRDINREILKNNDGRELVLMDSGGIGEIEGKEGIYQNYISSKIFSTLDDVKLILFVIDVEDFNPFDEEILLKIRKYSDKIILVVNKVDNEKKHLEAQNFYSLNIKNIVFVSAAHKLGIEELRHKIFSLVKDFIPNSQKESKITKIAFLGTPNTGKSTLLNLLTKKNLSLVSSIPNTTRDSIEGEFEINGIQYKIVDTAGIRRRAKIEENLEFYSLKRTEKVIFESDLVFLLLDLDKGEITAQDKKIASEIIERKKPIILVFNKIDKLEDQREKTKIEKKTRVLFPIFDFAPIMFISALKNIGIKELFQEASKILAENSKRVSTSKLNYRFREWIKAHPHPLDTGKHRVKLKYITQAESAPITFVMFVNKVDKVLDSYKKYIINKIREEFEFKHVPIFLKIKDNMDENRSFGRKN